MVLAAAFNQKEAVGADIAQLVDSIYVIGGEGAVLCAVALPGQVVPACTQNSVSKS